MMLTAGPVLQLSQSECALFGAGVLVLLFVVAAISYGDGRRDEVEDSRRRTGKRNAHVE